jgi:predicted metal-dependent HD superfamily phosphohydrolase
MMSLRELFFQTASVSCENQSTIESCWIEIEKAYTHKKRFYHNLHHLEHLARELENVKTSINQWDTVMFALFYHDVVYNAMRSDNEEKSAELAASRLIDLNVAQNDVSKCSSIIAATKKHAYHNDSDINYFTDADLSILGSAEKDYGAYFSKIRKEYGWFPDLIYNPGRKKVLQYFLQSERIFKTEFFFQKYESQARQNLAAELRFLGEKA